MSLVTHASILTSGSTVGCPTASTVQKALLPQYKVRPPLGTMLSPVLSAHVHSTSELLRTL